MTHGIELHGDARLHDLVRPALRRNPKRAHLLVSTVLGKHIPADPRLVHDTGLELGEHVRKVVGDESVAVLGFAETATGLGHCVAEALAAPYLHSTRRRVATAANLAAFEEEHSHATGHALLPEDPALLDVDTVVLADDELSTGRTAMNTIAALHATRPHRRYVIAALVDLRTPTDRDALAAFAADLGAEVTVVSLAAGRVDVPAGIVAPPDRGPTCRPDAHLGPRFVRERWPARDGGRHGILPAQTTAMREAARTLAAELAPELGADVLVLGTEELMYAPIVLGVELTELGVAAKVSSTTRSPVVALDEPGYPIRSALTFAPHDGTDSEPRFAYNVVRDQPWSDVIVVVDDDGNTDELAGLTEQLPAHRVHVVVVPTYRPLPTPLRGPGFGSYRADEVTWLLSDLSAVELEAPTEEREEAIQSGGAHYAESLPVEYQPDAAYLRLFEAALADSAERIAHAVGVVTEIVLAERGPNPVLASLARAGTPVGVLMRRWAAYAHGLDLPHYAVSIVRGRGIDEVALRYLAAHHDPSDVVFVDGWTGKGAIARELAEALSGTGFNPALAVLADAGSCVDTFGTREDFLVPSACLNSTVSGLVSRTVLNRQLLAPGQFHGAKFYRELAADDVSNRFLDTVTERFADVAAAVGRDWPALQQRDRTPTWSGWREIEQLSAKYEIDDVTLVKPGVGETTRVLLRRVPWAVLVRAGADGAEGIAHVRLLAEQRGVPVHEVADLTYRCVGLIHPRYTRGATGADGKAAQ